MFWRRMRKVIKTFLFGMTTNTVFTEFPCFVIYRHGLIFVYWMNIFPWIFYTWIFRWRGIWSVQNRRSIWRFYSRRRQRQSLFLMLFLIFEFTRLSNCCDIIAESRSKSRPIFFLVKSTIFLLKYSTYSNRSVFRI